MRALDTSMKALLTALGSTAVAVLAFTALRQTSAGLEISLFAALLVAGILNIGATASLNGELLLPTSGGPVGDTMP